MLIVYKVHTVVTYTNYSIQLYTTFVFNHCIHFVYKLHNFFHILEQKLYSHIRQKITKTKPSFHKHPVQPNHHSPHHLQNRLHLRPKLSPVHRLSARATRIKQSSRIRGSAESRLGRHGAVRTRLGGKRGRRAGDKRLLKIISSGVAISGRGAGSPI